MNDPLGFISVTFFEKLKTVPADTAPLWGKMSVQQMVEHLSDSVRYANGKDVQTEIVTPVERLQAVRDFLYSEKDFRPNTKNSKMGEEPVPVRHPDLETAVGELADDVAAYAARFSTDPSHTERNPFFGDLDFEGWNRLLYKHFLHHLRQFGAA
ncbi:MAG: hypothetical protein RL021_431 [Bacteroidota bacterium]|jgi:hypothetical protein